MTAAVDPHDARDAARSALTDSMAQYTDAEREAPGSETAEAAWREVSQARQNLERACVDFTLATPPVYRTSTVAPVTDAARLSDLLESISPQAFVDEVTPLVPSIVAAYVSLVPSHDKLMASLIRREERRLEAVALYEALAPEERPEATTSEVHALHDASQTTPLRWAHSLFSAAIREHCERHQLPIGASFLVHTNAAPV